MSEQVRTPERTRPHEPAWVDAPIPAWRVLRYIKAGLAVTEAIALEERHRAGEDIDAAVDTLIGLTSPERP